MSHRERIEGLTAAEAAEVEDEWRQLGARTIRRVVQTNGLVTMEAEFEGSPNTSDGGSDSGHTGVD